MTDLSVEILREIRDEIRATRVDLSARIDATNATLDATRQELSGRIESVDKRIESVEKRQTATELRLATELVAVAGAVRDLRDVLLADRDLRKRMDDYGVRIEALEKKVG